MKNEPVPIFLPSNTGEVKIYSTGGKGIIYEGDNIIITFKPAGPGDVTIKFIF